MLDKIMPLDALRASIETRQKEGQKVVFTNGCFDLIHVGHVRYLQAARALGDALVIAVNSDASVQQLKGPTRPIVCEAERLEVLAALSCVDYLALFSEETPLKVIKTLQPDFLVKGGDWAIENIVGRKEVEARGGKVLNIELVEGASTTSMIERVLERFKTPGFKS